MFFASDSKEVAKAVALSQHAINKVLFAKLLNRSVVPVTNGRLVSCLRAVERSHHHDRAGFVVIDEVALLSWSKSDDGWASPGRGLLSPLRLKVVADAE